MSIASVIVLLAGIYASSGLLFAIAFVFRGVAAVDPTAVHAPIGFRLIILPGATALWPVLARRWARSRSGSRAGARPADSETLERHS